MDFINKLIKKGIFGLIFVFAMFVYLCQTSTLVSAKTCKVTINDGNDHLVLNAGSSWTDDGVTVSCGTYTYTDVKVIINGVTVQETSDSGKFVSDSYVRSEGFYKIVYSYTDTDSIEHTATRQVRVLPQNLNSSNNIWIADESVNTTGKDVFNKVINFDDGYLAIGNFENEAYLVGYDLKGTFLWKSKIDGATTVNDIINTGTNKFYVAGETETGGYLIYVQPKTTSSETVFGTMISLDEFSKVNKIVTDGTNYYAAGYKLDDTTNQNYGVVAKVDDSSNVTYYHNTVSSQYNSLVYAGTNIVTVGSTSVSGEAGAVGGLVTVCSQDLSCSSKNAYFYTNSNGATTTTTSFTDIIKEGTKYLVVGQTRLDKHVYSTNGNFGQEDSFVTVLDANYAVLDIELVGTTGADTFNSIKKIAEEKFIAVGKFNNSGYYTEIEYDDTTNQLEIKKKSALLGTSSVSDVYILNLTNEENYYIFVGDTNSTKIEDVVFNNKKDATLNNTIDSYLVILDNTTITNYEDLVIVQGTAVCGSGITECAASSLNEKYFIYYGTDAKSFPSDLIINLSEPNTYETYHLFDNDRGITYLIYRSIIITSSSTAGDIVLNEQGINKWYKYQRTVTQTNKATSANRLDLWETIYYPVENYLKKQTGADAQKYYVIDNGGNFIEDTSGRTYTYNNYIVLENIEGNNEASLNEARAFKNIETLQKFALLQEFSRISVVNKRYNYDSTRIYAFSADQAKLRIQSYYYVYYIDLDFDNRGAANDSVCGLTNGALTGTCTNYGGYAFASMNSISKVVNLLLEKYNYFASENNSKYTGAATLPNISDYVEEVSTIEYTRSKTISLAVGSTNSLSLVVTHYPVNANGTGFEVASSPVSVSGKTSVTFSENGDFAEEGKYEVKYCYYYGEENQNCGRSAEFVIDRTAPVINYSLSSTTESSFTQSSSATQVELIKSTLTVMGVNDIDPYAYIKIGNKNYLLNCDFEDSVCEQELIANLTAENKFAYDSNNPDKIYELHVYDRAGNEINVYFKIGYTKPTVITNPSATNNNEFSLVVNFYDANDIANFAVTFTELNACTTIGACTDDQAIADAITTYINSIIDGNKKLLSEDPEAEITTSISLNFSKSNISTDNNVVEFTYGVNIPTRTYTYNITNEETNEGYWEYTETENWYVINEGLYEFVITDDFYNYSEAYAGIGLGKTDMEIFIEKDDDYEEDLEDIIKNDVKMPGETSSEATFAAVTPSTYLYTEYLSVTEATNSLKSTMFFTNQFIYVKFEISSYGVIQISEASKLNNYGNYEIENNYNLNCLITLYGENVTENFSDCGAQYETTSAADLLDMANGNSVGIKNTLNSKGIYIIAIKDSDVYVAFTSEGTYSITSEIKAKSQTTGGTIPTTAVTYDFSIDQQAPVIDFALKCKETDTKCLDSDNEILEEGQEIDYTRGYQKEQFTTGDTVVNIGKYDMVLTISDYFTFGTNGKSLNRLLVMKQGEDINNAYDYQNSRDIRFTGSGTYNIIFIDAAGNETVYKFMIDQTPPVIAPLTDAEGKDFTQYNQYVKVNVSVTEASFFDDDSNILTLYYEINDANPTPIIVKGKDGKCSTDSLNKEEYICSVTESGFTLSFVVAVNEQERITGTGSIKIMAEDYFGNSSNASRNFEFDNQAPYIYYGNIFSLNGSGVYEDTGVGYTPTVKNLIADGSDENKKKILEIDSTNIEYVSCENIIKTFGIDIVCNDTPESGQIKNNVKLKMYEAYEAAYNNYQLNKKGTYTLIPNGTFLDKEIYETVYKLSGNYSSISSKDELNEYIEKGDRKIYSHHIPVNGVEQVNPNTTYMYYNVGWKEVSIASMYESDTAAWSGVQLELYNLYMGDGTFEAATTQFYVYDDEEYGLMTDADDIQKDAYVDYYTLVSGEKYVASEGVYLPAKTSVNSCVMVDGTCIQTGANKIKLDGYSYYNTIYPMEKDTKNDTKSDLVVPVDYYDGVTTVSKAALLDTSIWQTSVTFRFGLPSKNGRPIIITSVDGAGNVGTNQLETTIIIDDSIAPSVSQVNTVVYTKDTSNSTTVGEDTYVRKEVYYKIDDIAEVSCSADTTYYVSSGNSLSAVACKRTENQSFDSNGNIIPDGWNEINQYYVLDYQYEKVNEGETKVDGTTYYVAEIEKTTNYITEKNYIVNFSEPISKIECSYYLYTESGGGIDKDCNINATRFSYTENKTSIELVFEGNEDLKDYYINYELTIYDFSNNSTTVKYLFIDRNNPKIKLNDNVENVDELEAKYPNSGEQVFNQYGSSYKEEGYKAEISILDEINDRITTTGSAAYVTNTLTSYVKYYKFNYMYAYNNYTYENSEFKPVNNGTKKVSGTTYYILIQEPEDYVLKGKSTCSDGYCYVIDDGNYYPELLKIENQISLADNKYWTEVEEISELAVGVYAIEYTVSDISNNVGLREYKTVYVSDTTKPVFAINDIVITDAYGYHSTAKMSVINEYESTMYLYTCLSASLTCDLPASLFTTVDSSKVSEMIIDITKNYTKTQNSVGVYKVFVVDRGSYEDAKDKSGATLKTLRYNYFQYTFIIDTTAPDFDIDAYETSDKKLYYVASLSQEEYLYCVKGEDVMDPDNYTSCFDSNFIRATESRVDESPDGNTITEYLYNRNGDVVSEIVYKRRGTGTQKYFYNTYYSYDGTSFVAYPIGTSFELTNNNVFLITSIKIYFREEGTYTIRGVDKAGNLAGREKSGTESIFTIDNTAPMHNSENFDPTGVNYWFSVPSQVVTDNNVNIINSVNNKKEDGYYSIKDSGLNNEFFYAFPTENAARNYLINIYTDYINNQPDKTCTTDANEEGIDFRYYNPSTGVMVSRCYTKAQALTTASTIINDLIFPTFSEEIFFGNDDIYQTVCDSTDYDRCGENKDMYVYVYLQFESTGSDVLTTITDTCVEGANTTCQLVRLKVVPHTIINGSNPIILEVKTENTKDTSKIIKYEGTLGATFQNPSGFTGTKTIQSLVAGRYYIFAEYDEEIEYPSSKEAMFKHINVTYYGLFVEKANEYLSVYYEENGVENNINIINSDGDATKLVNADEYYLILRNKNDDGNNKDEDYEMYYTLDDQGNIDEIYSYLRVNINGTYININRGGYIITEGSSYYIRIPLEKETYSTVRLIDRAGNVTTIVVSRSQIAPSIEVNYTGQGKEQAATVTITDTTLVKTNTNLVEVLFSPDGIEEYSSSQTANIKEALLCNVFAISQTNPYGCIKKSTINGVNSHEVKLIDAEDLYGFFKINLKDDHGNTNSLTFMYNPMDLTASITTEGSGVKYIGQGLTTKTARVVTKDTLQVQWDNEWNYIILYKVDNEGNLNPVCNTKAVGILNKYDCGNGERNRVEHTTIDNKYESSTLYYENEGLYQIEIINRKSETINTVCVVDGIVTENCKTITTHSSKNCAWDNNSDICDDALEINQTIFSVINQNEVFSYFEVDKTAPVYNTSNFVINLPSGEAVNFTNGEYYTNAEITIPWTEELTRLVFKCEYQNKLENNEIVYETCGSNTTSYTEDTRAYTFKVHDVKLSNTNTYRYTFSFEDYAGNTTTPLSFYIVVELPQISVVKLNSDGSYGDEVEFKETVNSFTKLICYVGGNADENCQTYDVKLYRYNNINGYELIEITNNTVIEETGVNTYKYVVAIKSLTTDYVYNNLSVETEFTIDRAAPVISLTGNKNELWGIYTGEVGVLVDSDSYLSIYTGCTVVGEDENKNKIYEGCNEVVVDAENIANYKISKTGIYKVVAEDFYGNKSQEVYFTIDNTNPDISIKAQGAYLEYEVSEKGYTNAATIVVESLDNNSDSIIKYRTKDANGAYSEWFEHSATVLTLTNEGYYEVQAIDLVGNEGIVRTFIIYRQVPKYSVYVGNKMTTEYSIITQPTYITWDKPTNDLIAPIVKVTMNGSKYEKRTVVQDTGEYEFVFTDLAGNTVTHKLTINTSSQICLDNTLVTPNKQYLFSVDNISFSGGQGYTFKENDVFLFATPTNYFTTGSGCGTNVLNYKTLSKDAYILVEKKTADHLNKNVNVKATVSDELRQQIEEAGGFVYVIVVDLEVAKKDLGFEIGESFFTKDPIGWSLIFVTGAGLLYLGIRLIFFRKKIKVLK